MYVIKWITGYSDQATNILASAEAIGLNTRNTGRRTQMDDRENILIIAC